MDVVYSVASHDRHCGAPAAAPILEGEWSSGGHDESTPSPCDVESVGAKPCCRTLRLATWNALTLDPEGHHQAMAKGGLCGGKVALVAERASELKLDMLCVQEARFRSEGVYRTTGFTIYSSASVRGARGVQLW
eukprot:7969787-Alexandrium_andersonii.AAC.1